MSFNQAVPLFRLYERTSKNGNTYLAGRLGLASVIAFRSKEPNEHGQYYYDVRISEPADRKDAAANYAKPDAAERKPAREDAAPFDRQRDLNDPIPF